MGLGSGNTKAQNSINSSATEGESSIYSSQGELNSNALSNLNSAYSSAEAQQSAIFGSQNSLLGLQNQYNDTAAQLTNQVDKENSADYMLQANYAISYANQQAQLMQYSINQTAANQAESYLSGGVEMQGTPLAQVNATRALGAIQVQNILQQGNLQAQLDITQSTQAQQEGKAAIVGASMENAMNGLSLGIQQGQQSMELNQQYEGEYQSESQGGEQDLLSTQQEALGVQQQGMESSLQVNMSNQQMELGLFTAGLSGGTSLAGAAIGSL